MAKLAQQGGDSFPGRLTDRTCDVMYSRQTQMARLVQGSVLDFICQALQNMLCCCSGSPQQLQCPSRLERECFQAPVRGVVSGYPASGLLHEEHLRDPCVILLAYRTHVIQE